MNADCRRTLQSLPGRHDESLDASERRHLEAHLDRCPGCRGEALVFESSMRDLRSHGRTQAAPDCWPRVASALGLARPSRASGRWTEFFVLPRFAWGAAMLAAGVLLGLLLGRTYLAKPPSPVAPVPFAQLSPGATPGSMPALAPPAGFEGIVVEHGGASAQSTPRR